MFAHTNNELASNVVQLSQPISKSTASILSMWISRLWHPPFYPLPLLLLGAGARDQSSITTSSQCSSWKNRNSLSRTGSNTTFGITISMSHGSVIVTTSPCIFLSPAISHQFLPLIGTGIPTWTTTQASPIRNSNSRRPTRSLIHPLQTTLLSRHLRRLHVRRHNYPRFPSSNLLFSRRWTYRGRTRRLLGQHSATFTCPPRMIPYPREFHSSNPAKNNLGTLSTLSSINTKTRSAILLAFFNSMPRGYCNDFLGRFPFPLFFAVVIFSSRFDITSLRAQPFALFEHVSIVYHPTHLYRLVFLSLLCHSVSLIDYTVRFEY